ncbi:glutathione S-transferase domain-containing protein [Sodiomyces alkalinus F11]|uniref:Glutathione S-transferase domain-containing protein n=1 Tax=Sodiomyces alkalinus (strain CBS 110278 / VKM F-3762 / F11) TaxID=1314773 RepID=A0A3N2PKT3_SODAK|nr:glutathione S-transferase domain-containing protein [Sodiomyces alkalinus F11]ROT35132.1 glutathione S-transferase domain-containing protein [Sodiomyces alkalinus F11]
MASVDTSIPEHATGAAAGLISQHSAEPAVTLYGSWFCPFVQRVWIILEEKKIPYQYVEINPYRKDPSFLAINPRGLVPALAVPPDDHGNPRKPLYDSTVIAEYLDEAFADTTTNTTTEYGAATAAAAAAPRFLPADDPYERARCRLWIDHINTRIVPAFYKFLQQDPSDASALAEARAHFLEQLRLLVREMDDTLPYFLGEEFSLVDAMLAPWAVRLFLLDHYKPGGVGVPAPEHGGENEQDWVRWRVWFDAVHERRSVRGTMSDAAAYVEVYKRYADNTTHSLVGQATRMGGRMP